LYFEGELRRSDRIIAAAFNFFSEHPESVVRFGGREYGNSRLREGWSTPEAGGVAALGSESRVVLPHPVAIESFVLTLDVSPYTDAPAPPAQRLIVAVNGEILREAVLSIRRQLHCWLPQRTIEAADELTITLLHPDDTSLASASQPLADHTVSVTLHSIALTPMSVYVKTEGTLTGVSPRGLVHSMREPFRGALYGPDVWIPAGARLGRLTTSWSTVVFADVDSGTLRHGPADSSPDNVMVADSRGTAYLFHVMPDGERYTVSVGPERRSADEDVDAGGASSAQIPERFQKFRVLWTEVDERFVFGLRSCGLLLCAEADGRVTLSRTVFGPWERFEPTEPTQPSNATVAPSHAHRQITGPISAPLEHITITAADSAAPLAAKARAAFDKAMEYDGKLPEELLNMEGMSGRKARIFLNNLIASLDDARYLEIGVWRGSTLCSAIYGNKVSAVAIDNWTQFGGPTNDFLTNLSKFKSQKSAVSILERDFRMVPFIAIEKHNVYTYDGPHEAADQYDGIALALPALDEEFILIVDDWNWQAVREGTLDAIATLKLTVDLQIEVKTTLDDTHATGLIRQHSDWHNGYFVAAVRKPRDVIE
jgi:hypothetical protein